MKKRGSKSNADLHASEKLRKKQENNTIAKVASLADFDDKYTKKIQDEKNKLDEQIKEIQKLITETQNKIDDQRKKLRDAPNEQQTSSKVSKQIQSLENKLDNNFKKYNQAVAHNKSLRSKIDALRKERILFDENLEKLEKELKQKKDNCFSKTIEEAEEAYQAREQAKKDMEMLKKEAEKEQYEFQVEWNKLENLIEKDKQLNDYGKAK